MTDEEALKEIGELIKHQENKARLKFVEKVKRLREMKSLE